MVALSDPQKPLRMSEAEYLEFERISEIKHEFLDGEIFAMSGASRPHNLICVNLIRMISTQFRGGDCEVYPSDMRVKISAGKYTYPDVSVVCGDATFIDDDLETLTNPSIIIEVLSPSTEGYDRGKKFQHYRKMPSLQEYILVAQDHIHLEHYKLQADGVWGLVDLEGAQAVLEFSTIPCTLPLTEIYERVTFPGDPAGSAEAT